MANEIDDIQVGGGNRPNPSGSDELVRQGGINQGQGTGTTGDLNDPDPKNAALRKARMGIGDLVDDNAASHQGGAGAQSGQADFGSAGNLAGMPNPTLGGSNPR